MEHVQERARELERHARSCLAPETLRPGSLEIARHVWRRLGHDDATFPTAWGQHVAPALFLTVAGLRDDNGVLVERLSRVPTSLTDLIDVALDAGLLDGEALFEVGGRFLDLLQPPDATRKSRCHDAGFGDARHLRLETGTKNEGKDDRGRESSPSRGVDLILASAVLEEGSGILRTLVGGAASRREWTPILTAIGAPPEGYDRYRQREASTAALELLAWCRNRLRVGGLVVSANVLGPHLAPDSEELERLGLRDLPPLFLRRDATRFATLETSVQLREASPVEDTPEAVRRTVREARLVGARLELRERERIWSVRGQRIEARWSGPDPWRPASAVRVRGWLE